MNDEGSDPTDREGVCDLVTSESDSDDASSQVYYIKNRWESIFRMSDRGVQYASREYIVQLQGIEAQISMSSVGNPYENAKAESFFKTLKQEEVYLKEYTSFSDAQDNLTDFIEQVYNWKRLHSSLGYQPPAEFETTYMSMPGS